MMSLRIGLSLLIVGTSYSYMADKIQSQDYAVALIAMLIAGCGGVMFEESLERLVKK